MPKGKGYSNSPTGGKHTSRGSNAEGPNSAGLKGKGGSSKIKSDGKQKAPNPGNIGVINRMNKSTHHTTS